MSKTLLLADDSVTIQKVVGISFASEDVTLLTVDNGDDAVARAREARPDLVLADVVMPGLSGYEVCAALKADPELRHIPVILLTGTFEAFDEERAREVGAASHVAKPFEAQTLVDEVKRVMAAPPRTRAPEAKAKAAPPAAPPRAETPRPAPQAAAAPDLADSSPDSPDDSFDFFDEDLGELAEAGADGEAWGDAMAPGALDMDRDAAFAFGDESLDAEPPASGATDRDSSRELPHLGAAAGGETQSERTVAILPEDPPSIGEADLHRLEPAAQAAPPPLAAAADDDAPPSGFEFSFEEETEGQDFVDPGDLAQDATVDPKGVSGFDISSSDLQGGAGSAAAPPPTVLAEPEPLGDTAPRPLDSLPEIEPLSEEDPLGEEEPLAEAEPIEEIEAVEPEIAAAPTAGAPDEVSAVLDAIAPQLREQLHASLEKIASESFQDVTERIVRQAVERVERIAWEVIPHMAETLVREEIRRMKGEK